MRALADGVFAEDMNKCGENVVGYNSVLVGRRVFRDVETNRALEVRGIEIHELVRACSGNESYCCFGEMAKRIN